MESRVAVYCADVGSISKNRFGWFGRKASRECSGTSIEDLAVAIANDLLAAIPVAVGFECPLFVPVSEDPALLTAARSGEGNRAWCAGGGAGALATGLPQVVWVLRKIRQVAGKHKAFLEWKDFRANASGLFIWEAFVSGEGKREATQPTPKLPWTHSTWPRLKLS